MSAILTITRPRRNDILFKMSKGEGSHIVYCTDYGDGEKSSSYHIFTNFDRTLEGQRECIRNSLAYMKDWKLADKVIEWFEKQP